MLSSGWLKSWMFIALFCILVALTGCHVKLVGEYDVLLDESVNEIQRDTASFINGLSRNLGTDTASYDNSKDFYSKAYGAIAALEIRAEALEAGLKKTPLTDNFKNLRMQYEEFEVLHKAGLNEYVLHSYKEALDMSYRAIVKHIVFIKWNQKQPN